MCDSDGWHIEKMVHGMFDQNYKGDAVYSLHEIRKDLSDHIAAVPSDTNQFYRDELNEIDFAISDALALINKRVYPMGTV